MSRPQFTSITKQVAEHLRGELRQGRWKDAMPGRTVLCRELGVSPKIVRLALDQLADEGLLLPSGKGSKRGIVPGENNGTRKLRISILHYEDADHRASYMLDLMHRLMAAGYDTALAERSLCDFKMNLGRIAAYVSKSEADAWIVVSAPHEILQWFSDQPIPVFALWGAMRRLPIAGAKPDKIPAQRQAVRRLYDLGHRRIVQFVRHERINSGIGLNEQAFINDLKALGISTGPYNLASWDGTKAGFHERMRSLFMHTPPTALFISEENMFMAAQLHLARIGFSVPEKISIISYDPDPGFFLCEPTIAHISWSYEPILRRILRWVENVSHGREDRRQSLTKASFVEGGSIGPAPSASR